MKDLILKASVGADMARRNFINKLSSMSKNEDGDIVQTILIIAGFVLICVIVLAILNNAIGTQATKVGSCISGAGTTGACSSFK